MFSAIALLGIFEVQNRKLVILFPVYEVLKNPEIKWYIYILFFSSLSIINIGPKR